jgi:hypothetical protein
MQTGKHRVHFSYWSLEGVWFYRFIGDGVELLGPVRRTRDPNVLRGIAERGGGLTDLESRNMLDYGIGQGQGGLYLHLTDEQFARLK